jgi:hypothetical protein
VASKGHGSRPALVSYSGILMVIVHEVTTSIISRFSDSLIFVSSFWFSGTAIVSRGACGTSGIVGSPILSGNAANHPPSTSLSPPSLGESSEGRVPSVQGVSSVQEIPSVQGVTTPCLVCCSLWCSVWCSTAWSSGCSICEPSNALVSPTQDSHISPYTITSSSVGAK